MPARSVEVGQFGWLGRFFGGDCAASSELTRELTGWQPTRPDLLADIGAGSYDEAEPAARA